MPWLVNNERVPEGIIRDAEQWVSRDPRWQTIADPVERGKRVHETAVRAACDRVLVQQIAKADPR